MAVPTTLHIGRPCMRCTPRPCLRALGGGGQAAPPCPGQGGGGPLLQGGGGSHGGWLRRHQTHRTLHPVLTCRRHRGGGQHSAVRHCTHSAALHTQCGVARHTQQCRAAQHMRCSVVRSTVRCSTARIVQCSTEQCSTHTQSSTAQHTRMMGVLHQLHPSRCARTAAAVARISPQP